MATPGKRKLMARNLAILFTQKGKILSKAEYSDLEESAPYRLSYVTQELGQWPRVIEKIRTACPEMMKQLAEPTPAITMAERVKQAAQDALNKLQGSGSNVNDQE